jgi:endonuclease-3
LKIENAIRIGGLAPTKAKRIKDVLRTVSEKNKSENHYKNGSPYHLDFLKKMDMGEAHQFLVSIKGIGEKTAACVLLFSLQKPAFPIDTHVYRILVRQGIIPSKMPVEKALGFMLDLIDPGERYRFHVNLITYGREVCHSRNPECSVCIIKRTCCYVR